MKILVEIEVEDVDDEHEDALHEKLCENIEAHCDEYFMVDSEDYCDCDQCPGHEEEIRLYVTSARVVSRGQLLAEDLRRSSVIGSSVL